MIARRTAAVLLILAALLTGSIAGPAPAGATSVRCAADPAPPAAADVDRAWSIALQRLARRAGPPTLPFGATGDSRYVRTNPYAWTSGFYPAGLWLAYARTRDQAWRDRARAYTRLLLPVASWRGSHDLGFMVGLPTALAERLDPERADEFAAARQTAARSLATRWNGRVQALRSATYNGRWGVIIDSAMNAPLLIEEGRRIGGIEGRQPEGRRLERRGLAHLRTLARTFIRADGSTAHRQAFDPATGQLLGPIPGQGRGPDSTWARGQAWAVHGFADAYRLTGDPGMLDAARRTADLWVARVPAGCVPAWDLDVDDPRAPLDSSAAAIVVDGLLALAETEPDPSRAATYRSYALATLGTLVRPPFLDDRGRGVLDRQTYNVPADAREGTYVWGDLYLLAALSRSGAAVTRQRSMTSSIR